MKRAGMFVYLYIITDYYRFLIILLSYLFQYFIGAEPRYPPNVHFRLILCQRIFAITDHITEANGTKIKSCTLNMLPILSTYIYVYILQQIYAQMSGHN